MNKYSEIKKDAPIIFDACIFMVGIDKRHTDSLYSLKSMRANLRSFKIICCNT